MGNKIIISRYIPQQSQPYFLVLASFNKQLPCSAAAAFFQHSVYFWSWTLADLNFEFFSLNDRKVLISRSKKSDWRWICLVSITTCQPHLSSIWSAGVVFPGPAHPPAIIRSGMNYSPCLLYICAWLGGKQELVANGCVVHCDNAGIMRFWLLWSF